MSIRGRDKVQSQKQPKTFQHSKRASEIMRLVAKETRTRVIVGGDLMDPVTGHGYSVKTPEPQTQVYDGSRETVNGVVPFPVAMKQNSEFLRQEARKRQALEAQARGRVQQ